MKGRYAEGTSVPVERSQAEIQRVLAKVKASKYGTMHEPGKATVYCEVKGRQIQISVPLPTSKEIWKERQREQEIRRRWRVLLITIKAMLEAVESKLLTFDQAFLPFIVIPGTARTIGEAIVPKLDALYQGRSLPALLAENPEEAK